MHSERCGRTVVRRFRRRSAPPRDRAPARIRGTAARLQYDVVMAESHRRTAGSSSRLTPEEITNRSFASAFRGISETEVRNFLKRVADDIGAMRAREADLVREV